VIAREWRCLCPIVHRDAFLLHLDATGVRETSSLPGYRGHQILEHDMEGGVEITLVTYWDRLESITAFAGEDIGRARLYPGDEPFCITPDKDVRHYRVLSAALPAKP
jgi:heme-degrading monooxygenase HmoA